MKVKLFLRIILSSLMVLCVSASVEAEVPGTHGRGAARPSVQAGPEIPELMSFNPYDNAYGHYILNLIWGMRKTPASEVKSLASKLSARARFSYDMMVKMKSGQMEYDSDAYDKFEKEMSCWATFYAQIISIVNIMSGAQVHKDERGLYYYDGGPRFMVGTTMNGVPASQEGVKATATFTRINGKSYFCEPNLDPTFASKAQVETAKLDLNMFTNFKTLFEGYPVEWCRATRQGVLAEEYDICAVKIRAYVKSLEESIKGNSTENIEFKPMPKGGKLNASLKAKALAVEKAKDPEIMDCIITSDMWDVKKNAAGVPVRRVVYGYIIYKAEMGKMATKYAWAEEYQNGKYGPLHSFGVGTGSFYVK